MKLPFPQEMKLPFSQEMAVMECKALSKVPQSDVELITNRKMPQSREGKCMMACILKKMKVMTNDGRFDARSVKKWMGTRFKGDTQKLAATSAITDECAKELIETAAGADECEMATLILQCSKKQGRLAKKAAMKQMKI